MIKPLSIAIAQALSQVQYEDIDRMIITDKVRRLATREYISRRQQELLTEEQLTTLVVGEDDPMWRACKMAEFSILVAGYQQWL